MRSAAVRTNAATPADRSCASSFRPDRILRSLERTTHPGVEGILREPLLYLSLYFKQNRQQYYDLLDMVRHEGDWERWLAFFADAVRTTAEGAVETARTLVGLFQKDRDRIGALGRGANSALRVHHELQRRPLSTVASLSRATKLSPPTVGKALEGLAGLGIVRETTGRRRNRVFVYSRYLAQLNEGTEAP